MAITPLPTPPSRDDPANFAARGDAFLGALPTFATEANALAVAVNTDATNAALDAADAVAASAAAAAAANATKWVSGTTYTEGVVVWSPMTYMTYRRKTTGGGTTDPSIDTTNWAQAAGTGTGDVTLGGVQTLTNKTLVNPILTLGGVEGTAGQVVLSQGNDLPPVYGNVSVPTKRLDLRNSTSDITITAAQMGYHVAVSCASGISVTLPNATLIGDEKFIIIRNSSQSTSPIAVKDFTGRPLFYLPAGVGAYVWLVDGTASTGVWAAINQVTREFLNDQKYLGNLFVPRGSSSRNLVSFISATKALHLMSIYNDQFFSWNLTVISYDANGNAISASPLMVIADHQNDDNNGCIIALSETKAILIYGEGAVTCAAYPLTINGTSITKGNRLQISTGTNDQYKASRLSDSTAIWACANGTGSVITMNSDGSLTNGNVNTTLGNAVSNIHDLCALSSSIAVRIRYSTTSLSIANVLQVTGSGSSATITANADVNAVADYAVSHNIRAHSSSLCVFAYRNGSTGNARAVAMTVSGTTLTAGSPTTIDTGNYNKVMNSPVNATEGAIIYSTGSTVYAKGYSVSGTTITYSATSLTLATEADYFMSSEAICSPLSLSANKVSVYRLTPTNFANGVVTFSVSGITTPVLISDYDAITRGDPFTHSHDRTVAVLSEQRAIVLLNQGLKINGTRLSVRLYAYLIDTSGPMPVVLDTKEIYTSYANICTVCALGSTSAIVAYTNTSGGACYGKGISISGNTMSVGSQLTLSSTATNSMSISYLNSSAAFFCKGYSDAAGNYGQASIITISGNTISQPSTHGFETAGSSGSCNAVVFSSTYAAVVYSIASNTLTASSKNGTGGNDSCDYSFTAQAINSSYIILIGQFGGVGGVRVYHAYVPTGASTFTLYTGTIIWSSTTIQYRTSGIQIISGTSFATLTTDGYYLKYNTYSVSLGTAGATLLSSESYNQGGYVNARWCCVVPTVNPSILPASTKHIRYYGESPYDVNYIDPTGTLLRTTAIASGDLV